MGRKRKATVKEEFDVEYIIAAAPVSEEDKTWTYHVKWFNYPESENTWEPEENLDQCEGLLERFWLQFPEQYKWKPGEVAYSSPAWIAKEIEYCKKHVKKKNPQSRKKARLQASSSTASASREVSVASSAPSSSRVGRGKRTLAQDDPDDSPLSSAPPSPELAKLKSALPVKKDSPPPPPPPPPISTTVVASTAGPVSATATATPARKRRLNRPLPKVNTSDNDDPWTEESYTSSDSDDDDRPLTSLRRTSNAQATRPVRKESSASASTQKTRTAPAPLPKRSLPAYPPPMQVNPRPSGTAPSRRTVPTTANRPTPSATAHGPTRPAASAAARGDTSKDSDSEKDSLFDGSDSDDTKDKDTSAEQHTTTPAHGDSTSTGPVVKPAPGPSQPPTPVSATVPEPVRDPRRRLSAVSTSAVVPDSSGAAGTSKQAAMPLPVRRTNTLPTPTSASESKLPAHRQKPKVKIYTEEVTVRGGTSTKAKLTSFWKAPSPPPPPPPAADVAAPTQKPVLSLDTTGNTTSPASAPPPAATTLPSVAPTPPLGHAPSFITIPSLETAPTPEFAPTPSSIDIAAPVPDVAASPALPLEHASTPQFDFGGHDGEDIPMTMSPDDLWGPTVMSPPPASAVEERSAAVDVSSPISPLTSVEPTPITPNITATIRSEADDFLRSIVADSIVDINTGDMNTGGGTQRVLPRIPKKFLWEGDLILGSESACRVRLQDAFPTTNAMPVFRIKFSNMQSLQLNKTFSMAQRSFFFPFFEVVQWAKLVPPEETPVDERCFSGFSGHLELNGLFSIVTLPVHDNGTPHHLVVMHNTATELITQLKCPPHLYPPLDVPGLLAAIVQAPKPSQLEDVKRPATWFELLRVKERRAAAEVQRVQSQSLVRHVWVPPPHRPGVKLPDELITFMNNSCVYGIFTGDLLRSENQYGSYGVTAPAGMETADLVRALSATTAQWKKISEASHIIFIHLDHWRNLNKLPGLAHRRSRADIQFWSYGTSPLARAGTQGGEVRQIFPCGGVVTFTARAIATHPEKVQELIKAIDQHPLRLWTCYIIPEVLGLVKEMTTEAGYDQSKLSDAVTAVSSILSPIGKGRISLIRHPPPSWDTDGVANWEFDQSEVLKNDPIKILEYSVAELGKHRRQERNKEDFVDQLICDDLRQMEANPTIHTSYRRFVIIYEDTHDWGVADMNADGFERVFPDVFSFGDDTDKLLLRREST